MPPIPVAVVRKPRAWAARDEAIVLLGRSAKYVAKTSARRISQKPIARRLSQFIQLAALEDASKMTRADLLVRLIDEDSLRAIDVARATGLRQSDLSQMYATAKMFPRSARPTGVPFNIFLLATRMHRKFPELKMRPHQVLTEITKTGLSQHRDISRHFAELSRVHMLRKALPLAKQASIINSTHNCSFQQLLPDIPDGAAKIIHIDPPYLSFHNHNACAGSTSRPRRTDNPVAKDALSVVIDLLRDWQPKLALGGVVLLWQASGPLLPEIIVAIRRAPILKLSMFDST